MTQTGTRLHFNEEGAIEQNDIIRIVSHSSIHLTTPISGITEVEILSEEDKAFPLLVFHKRQRIPTLN